MEFNIFNFNLLNISIKDKEKDKDTIKNLLTQSPTNTQCELQIKTINSSRNELEYKKIISEFQVL
jgi:hypothetical protein